MCKDVGLDLDRNIYLLILVFNMQEAGLSLEAKHIF